VINELLRSAQSTDSLAGEDLRDLVRKERHPKSEQIRQQIKEIKKSMNLPSGLQIEVPADLENGQTKITLSFRRQEEFQKLLGEMDQAFSAKLSEILKLV
jgi:LPS O-antigen subunit length determinant protein (WzzB/FepE family)